MQSKKTISKNIIVSDALIINNGEQQIKLFGPSDDYIKQIELAYDVNISLNEGILKIIAKNTDNIDVQDDNNLDNMRKNVQSAKIIIEQLLALINRAHNVETRDVTYLIEAQKSNIETDNGKVLALEIARTNKGKPISVKSAGQKQYVKQIHEYDIVFGIGPAGSGKTFLAVVLAVQALKEQKVKKIILTRPAVEAGEHLGFLPGDLQEKVDPYLRPLYDALEEMLGYDTMTKLLERKSIEVAPLAFMRGRTLNDSFVILDEAQNTTREQMKMFLTRLGFNSKMVITGDVTQIDLPKGKKSGLCEAVALLKNVIGIGITSLSEIDIVRHRLVQKIVKAYETVDDN